jgi:peptide/nickel transport system substrate-binding protein
MDPDLNSPNLPLETKERIATTLTKKRELRRLEALENIMASFRPSERLLLYVLTIVLSVSVFIILAQLNASVSTVVPARGGSIVEGEVGTARFINPILATSQADQDLTMLVYSGLTRALPHGEIVPDLASSYTISEDGTVYTFTIRDDAVFHDGTPISSDDIHFTIQAAQNPEIRSPRRADWEGVTVSVPDARTVIFTLPHPYAPFIYNTTLGILPKHLWRDTASGDFSFSQLNTRPIGSGPYYVTSATMDSTGTATRYDLEPFSKFTLGAPYLKRISFAFYPNERDMVDAWKAGKIQAMSGISSSALPSPERSGTHVISTPLPRVFGIFFNQSHAPILTDASLRMALNAALDKEAIVETVLFGHGTPLEGPIPPGVLGITRAGTTTPSSVVSSASSTTTVEKARAILSKGGWTFDDTEGTWKNKKKQVATFSLATTDAPELVATANAVAGAWRRIGVEVNVQVYSLSELNTSIIRPRSYDAILFGEVVGREGDLFAFWHSSQRNDPGLNLAMYANSKADSLLTEARATTEQKDRDKLYEQFAAIVQKDYAAVFLYSPNFLYVMPDSIKGVTLGALTTPGERFINVYQWYTDTERVWEVFADPHRAKLSDQS